MPNVKTTCIQGIDTLGSFVDLRSMEITVFESEVGAVRSERDVAVGRAKRLGSRVEGVWKMVNEARVKRDAAQELVADLEKPVHHDKCGFVRCVSERLWRRRRIGKELFNLTTGCK